MTKVPVSVIIPVLNEGAILERCINSLTWAGEIFVVDSGSSDNTVRVAESLGASVVRFKSVGAWPKKKNWALENVKFANEWVLIIDADEVMPPCAEEEIRAICTCRRSGYDGYFINRRFMFMGKWLRHAYYPNWNMRLFKHSLGRYEKLTELETFSGDNEVHEHIVLNGRAGYLKSVMDHYAFPTIASFVEKHNRYSNWEARVAADTYFRASSAFYLGAGNVGRKRFLKSLVQKLPFRPFLRFLYVYLFQLGFLDGREGYYFAKLHAFYEFLCVSKTYELKKQLAGGKR